MSIGPIESEYLGTQGYIDLSPLGLGPAVLDVRGGADRSLYESTDLITHKRFDSASPLPWDCYRCEKISIDSWEKMLNPNVLAEATLQRRILWEQQQDMCNFFDIQCNYFGFEKTWLEAGAQRREEAILEAYCHLQNAEGMTFIGDNGREKMNCPELTFKSLTADSGHGFLRLMRLFSSLIKNVTVRPVIFDNERFNKIIGWSENDPNELRKAWAELRKLNRTNYLVLHMDQSLRCFHGVPKMFGPTSSVDHIIYKMDADPELKEKYGAKNINAFLRSTRTKVKKTQLHCDYCLKVEKKEVNGKMGVCAACLRVGKEIRYCGRACQKLAWKEHKRFCGKPINVKAIYDDIVPFPVTDIPKLGKRDLIAPGRAAHMRPPALRMQLALINDPGEDDPYTVYMIGLPKTPMRVSFGNDCLVSTLTFILVRNRAMTTDEPCALGCLIGLLLSYFEAWPIEERVSLDDIITQMCEEYGDLARQHCLLVLSNAPPGPMVFLRPEVDEVLNNLKLDGRFLHFLEGYTPGEGGTIKRCLQQNAVNRGIVPEAEAHYMMFPECLQSSLDFLDAGLPKATASEDTVLY